MQVILIKSVRKLGRVGTKVDVSNGYGRNYEGWNGIGAKYGKYRKSWWSSICIKSREHIRLQGSSLGHPQEWIANIERK